MWRLTLACGVLFLIADFSVVMRGLVGNLSDLTVASSQYDILLCSETLVSDMRIWSPCLFVPGQDASDPRMAAYVQDGYGAICQPKFECGRTAVFSFVVRDRTIMSSVFTATLT